jgi:hypothetical protein
MTDETKATVKVLDHCCIWFYWHHDSDLTRVWKMYESTYVGLRKYGFVAGTSGYALRTTNSFWAGFDMIENIATHPEIAKKLAEPIGRQ